MQLDTLQTIRTPAQEYLCSNPSSGRKLRKIASSYNIIDASSYKVFALLVGDVILGLKTFEGASTEFVTVLKLDLATAAALANEVGQFLAPINDPNWQLPQEFSGASSAPEEPSQPIPAYPSSTTGTLPQVRTMAKDGAGMSGTPYSPTPQIGYDNTPTHQSSQEHVFEKRP